MKKVTFTLDEKLVEELKKQSNKTQIPQARLVSNALKDYLKKVVK